MLSSDILRSSLAALVLLGISEGPAAGSCVHGQDAAWPGEQWEMAEPADPAAVAAFDALAFPPGQDERSRDGPRTNGPVIVRDGRLVHERYARGFGPETPHIV